MAGATTDRNASACKHVAAALLFCLACVAINFAGSRIVAALGAPLYLDSIGTMIAGMMGGYVPAVLVGYVTNLLTAIYDSSSLYYSGINVLIGVAAAFCASHGWFKSLPKSLLAIVIYAFIGGGVASVLTWRLYGFSFGEGITAPLVHTLYESGLPAQLAQLSGDFLIDMVDKALSVVISVALTRAFASTGLTSIDFGLWQQAPMSAQQRREAERDRARFASIKTKIAVILSTVMIVVVAATTWISYLMFNDSTVAEQTTYAFGITNLAIQAIDPSRVDDFLAQGDAAEGYAETEAALAQIRDSFPAVAYIYAYRIQEDGCHVVLDPDTEDEPGSDPGEVVGFDDAFLAYRDDLLEGKPIEDAVISNETYGWLLTVYVPLYDDAGTCQCYVATDILMDHIVMDGYVFLVHIISLFCAFFILVCAIILWLAEYGIILPLNTISHVNSQLDFSDEESRARSIERMRSLSIHTGDEIESLYDAVVRTTQETARHITESEEQAATIARMQDNLIMVMADLVESRDQYTGDHIRKTTAYVKLILDEMRRQGVYADQLTDEFMFNVEHSAPLHDVGKIVISDTILNKPGRLTDEEFDIMKTHTTAGREIIEHAVAAVSEPTYLDEAKRIAEFHHEKWNGTGYPQGLKAEDIPLSARIMAVADVFDALVSKRSYKDGFPLDRAFAIIEEGIGTHFDPEVARTFLAARDKAAQIARDHGDVSED